MRIHGGSFLAALQGMYCYCGDYLLLTAIHDIGLYSTIYIPELKTRETTNPSDREKGLSIAIEDIFPQAYRGYCCQHIVENMKTKFGLAIRDAFYKVAKGRSVLDFNDALKELGDPKPSAAQYLQAIDPALYSVSRYPGSHALVQHQI